MRCVYLAGPEIFLPNAKEMGARKKALCARHGFEGLFPLDNDFPVLAPEALAHTIYRANIGLMDRADLMIANMTPFRGPSMDAGTAFEVGYGAARGIPVFGYSNVASVLAERTPGTLRDGVVVDEDGLEIENLGLRENLMIEIAMRESAGPVFASDAPHGALYTDLGNFEAALKHAAEKFAR